ncbi:MAG: four helix bundle protein [Bacteroidales bacterium]|nr:four helix bundle protein [Bacteroidales bacterium]
MVIMKGKDENILVVKSKNFAVRIIRMYQWIRENKNEYLLCKQCVRSGTSIGANIREAIAASSKADFTAKLNISLKEANETQYWLELFRETDYIDNTMFESMNKDIVELLKLLTSILKSTRKNMQNKEQL